MTDSSRATPLAGLTVLIVDDDNATRYVWRHLLTTSIPGTRTAEAQDGAEALRLAQTLQPDVILMDIVMPKPDGLEVTRRLKGDPSTSHIAIIVITGRQFSVQAAIDAGCNGYLTKPVEPEKLVQELSRVLRRDVRKG